MVQMSHLFFSAYNFCFYCYIVTNFEHVAVQIGLRYILHTFQITNVLIENKKNKYIVKCIQRTFNGQLGIEEMPHMKKRIKMRNICEGAVITRQCYTYISKWRKP